jgi:signal transduction histidine kinase
MEFDVSRAHPKPLQFTAALLAVVPIAALVAGLLFTPLPDDSIALGVGAFMVAAIPASMGWAIQRARPGNVIGWLLLAHSTALVLGFSTDVYTSASIADHGGTLPGTALAAYASEALWPSWFAGLAAIAFVFPDGHLPSPRWRRFVAGAAATIVGFIVLSMFDHARLNGDLARFTNPLPELPGPVAALRFVFVLGILVSLIGSALAVRARLKRAAGVERLQLLWLAYAALALPGALLFCWLDAWINDGNIGPLTLAGLLTMAVVVPLAIGIGILRYRLFDIELAISRTLVYGTLSVCVAALYVGVLTAASAAMGSRGAAGLLAAGLIAVSIQPLHARLQRRVDRLVYGDRTQPYAALQRLSGKLQETLAPAEVVRTVVESVAEALRLPYVAVELERDGAPHAIVSHGTRGRGRIERRQLTYRGEPEGTLAVEVPATGQLGPADSQLLDDLVRHAGVAVQSVRLMEDLQRSRRDLVTAREEERRRLRRDLHDGLGPTLAAMSLRLEVLRDHVSGTGGEIVDTLGREVQDAIADIRRLVYALRPPVLDEYGLLPALTEQATRLSTAGSAVEVHGPDPMPPLPAAVEVAAYRIALEAMTNAQRHGGGNLCTVTIALNGGLVVSVADNGVGFAPDTRRGVGLTSMRERAAELGGTLAVDSAAATGTTVRATLPMGSS